MLIVVSLKTAVKENAMRGSALKKDHNRVSQTRIVLSMIGIIVAMTNVVTIAFASLLL